jgi:amino acid transporter
MGYQSTSFFISEVRDPIRTLRRATLLAVSSLTVLYLIINLSYLAAISKNDILNGGRIVGYTQPYTHIFCH